VYSGSKTARLRSAPSTNRFMYPPDLDALLQFRSSTAKSSLQMVPCRHPRLDSR
jgi:hypothetical protein